MPRESVGSGHVQGQPGPTELDLEANQWRGLHLPLLAPQGFQPQLGWQTPPSPDWERWTVTAKVTVVAEGAGIKNSAHKTKHSTANVGIQTHLTHCPASGADLTQVLPQQEGASTRQRYSIQVSNITIGALPDREAAEQIAAQIRRTIATLEDHPSELQPQIGKDRVRARVNDQTVFELTDDLVPDQTPSMALVATAWVNNLRHVFGAASLDLGTIQMVAQGLGETDQVIGGTASWYGPYFHGRLTATGEVFNQHELTAAHKTLPFGTMLKVRNVLNDKSVVVRINDRGPYIGDRSLDLSYAAAQCLDSEIVGVIPYEATLLEPGVPKDLQTKEFVEQKK